MKQKIKLKDLTKEQYETWRKFNCMGANCNTCPFLRAVCSLGEFCWVKNKELYSNKFLDQEIEIEVKDKDETLLTLKEKEYLEGVIRPFKDKVEHIMKYYIDDDEPTEYIYIDIKKDFPMCLPCFEPNKYYKGLERTKRYTLKELGLFEEKKYKITLTEFWNSKERLAIHCDTEEKANKFIKESNKTNKWGDFGNYYEDYKEKTCYSNDSDYYDLNSYKEDNYTIYEFDEVDLEN